MHTEASALDVAFVVVVANFSLFVKSLLLFVFNESLEPVFPIENFTFELPRLGIVCLLF